MKTAPKELTNEPAKYKIMRGWRDGEIMEPHAATRISRSADVTEIEFDDLDAAIRYTAINGGWIERTSDSAIFVGAAGWIDDTGLPIT